MSCAEEQDQNQSHSKSGERDGNGWIGHVLRMPPAALPQVALLMAVEREADQKKHGEGQWRKR